MVYRITNDAEFVSVSITSLLAKLFIYFSQERNYVWYTAEISDAINRCSSLPAFRGRLFVYRFFQRTILKGGVTITMFPFVETCACRCALQ